MKIAATDISANGIAFMDISSIVAPPMPDATNRFSPNGGVWKPTASAATMTTPKCTGSTPRLYMIGSSTGVRIIIVARVSMNMPTNSRKAMIRPQITYMFSVRSSSASATIGGMSFSTNRRPNTVAVNRISSTRPVIQVVVSREWEMSFRRSSLWTNTPIARV